MSRFEGNARVYLVVFMLLNKTGHPLNIPMTGIKRGWN